MKKRVGLLSLSVVFFMVALTGCASTLEQHPGAVSGGAIGATSGAVLGAVLGHQVGKKGEGAIIGAILGGLAGATIGHYSYDQKKVGQVLEKSPSNVATSWVNPDTQNSYTMVPKPAYTGAGGRVCREFYIEGVVAGRPEKALSKACRSADGIWELQ